MHINFKDTYTIKVMYAQRLMRHRDFKNLPLGELTPRIEVKLMEMIYLFHDNGKFYRGVEFVVCYLDDPRHEKLTLPLDHFVIDRNIEILMEREIKPKSQIIRLSEAEVVQVVADPQSIDDFEVVDDPYGVFACVMPDRKEKGEFCLNY